MNAPEVKMGIRHDVYPGDMGREIEDEANRLDTSVSGLYCEGIRRMAQDPNHPLEISDTNE